MLSTSPSFYNADTLFLLSYSRGGRSGSNRECIPTFRKKDLSREKWCFKHLDNAFKLQSCGSNSAALFLPNLYQVIKVTYSKQFFSAY